MKKEVLIAVISGLILGLIITLGIFTANRSLNEQRAKKAQQTRPTPSLIPSLNNKTLNLTSHENNDLLDQKELILSGIAWPNTIIVLISEADTQLIQADAEGIFSFTTVLIKGFNELTVIAADETGSTQTQNLILTYSTNKVELQTYNFIQSVYAAETETASPEAESVTEKIKERLQNTVEENLVTIKEEITGKAKTPRKKAYVGKIVSLDNANITLSYKEQPQNIVTNKNTIYIKGANTPMDREDLTVGDFVIAMGFYLSDSQEFQASRVSAIANPEPPVSKQLIQGKISEIDGQKLTVNNKILILSKTTKLSISGLDEGSIDDLALSDYLFAIVALDGNGDIDKTDRVLVIPGKNNPAGLTPTNINATESASASPSAKNAQ